MPEGTITLNPGTGGKNLRTRERVVGSNTVQEQAVWEPGADTFYAYADAVVPAGSKNLISIMNAIGSGRVVKVRKLFCVNLQTGAVTGVIQRHDIRKITALSGGTAITPVSADDNNGALPAQITTSTGGTTTDGAILFPWITVSEETPATQPLNVTMFQQATNILLEGPALQGITLREGRGMTVKQVTASTVGSLGFILAFTTDTP